MEAKTFTNRSNARRAARAAGIAADKIEIVVEADGRFAYREAAATRDTLKVPKFLRRTGPLSPEESKRRDEAAREVRVQLAAEQAKNKPSPPAKPAKAKVARGPTKIETLLDKAKSKKGLSRTELVEITGWTKFGGFFGGAKKAGLKLRSEKKDGETVWFADAA